MALRRFDLEAGGENFAFDPDTEPTIEFWLGKYPAGRKQSAVIPLLWLAQKDNGGWLSEPAMRTVADRLEMPYIRVYEVATFYTMFKLAPVGKHHVQLCGTTPCMLRGAEDLKKVCQRRIGKPMAVTDDGKLSWEEVECLGACVNAPMVQINEDYFEDLTPESFEEIIEKLRNGADVEPGPQTDRVFSEPTGGTDVLTDPALFDGSRAAALARVPNAPEEPPEPEAKGEPPAEPPTNTVREEVTDDDVERDAAEISGDRPEPMDVPHSRRDDLKQIRGIGPVNEAQLNDLGIFTFAQIAGWTGSNVEWVEGYLSFPGRIGREEWIAQARQLAGQKDKDA
ncbi:MAG: NADH-quinone oxidoreductase subunit NuoE [Alphaproteobacteria bacterium]|jgi:NADH-quinone oxidoreductase subunit E|nr:NADH-quinone oxidoreductase subunit NuoE [Alphaproteobacteria bacterium]